MSPSSRRAWIEITTQRRSRFPPRVALLAEGVDRNPHYVGEKSRTKLSPSSRRAWIEIEHQPKRSVVISVALLAEGVDRNQTRPLKSASESAVALLAEGVDRNAKLTAQKERLAGRPPRGGRG